MSLLEITAPQLKHLRANSSNLQAMSTQKNILIVDDDDVFIFLTRKLLQISGKVASINVSYSAEDAIDYLKSNDEKQPDIILLDLNMPGMGGWQFLNEYQSILQIINDRPALFVVSSSIAENDEERAMKINGVTGYIPKPITLQNIQQILR